MLREEKRLEFVFGGRGSSILGEVVPDEGTKIGERAKATSFVVKASEFEYFALDISPFRFGTLIIAP